MHEGGYLCHDGRQVLTHLVLPKTKDPPPGCFNLRGDRSVAENVTPYLGDPVGPVRLGDVPVLWATVPEATVHEHGHPYAGKHNVGLARQTRLQTVTEPCRPQGFLETKLWGGVLVLDLRHAVAALLAGKNVA